MATDSGKTLEETARKEFQRTLFGKVNFSSAMGSLSEGVIEFLLDKEYVQVDTDGLRITNSGRDYVNHQY